MSNKGSVRQSKTEFGGEAVHELLHEPDDG